ncbi:MAG: alpha/beta fold hydrolase [Novosphingobium sp.]
MAGFVLIHGSWHGGWCFDEVVHRLQAAGHRVIAPTLPGMGGDEAELRAVTLQGWADFAVAQCRALKDELGGAPVVLAGHSRGGLVVSQAAETDPAAMDALVYICAMMLPSGMSRAQFKTLEEPTPDFDALIAPVGHGAGTVVDAAGAGPVFAQLSPPELVAAALPRLLAEPHGPRATPLQLTSERWGSLPRTYVETLEDRTIPITSQRKMQALTPGAAVVTLSADHSPYLSAPDALAAALVAAIPGGPADA